MTNLRLAIPALCGLLLTTSAVAQQPSAKSPQLVPASNHTCASAPPVGTMSFDPCAYLPLGNGVKVGRAISIPDPAYSEFARQHKITGTVVLAVALNVTGGVDAVKVVRPLEPSLDQHAIEAVQKWKFTPAMKDGNPVAVQMEVSVGFNLY